MNMKLEGAERQIHDLVQGSAEWHAFRAQHFGASEAAAMLGISPHQKRSDLLTEKLTGVAKEHSDYVENVVFARGHRVEALGRSLAEEVIGEDLFPVTYSLGKTSASLDGINLDETVAWENKQWNESLAASLREGVLPEHHKPQCQQILMVSGADKLLFTCTDGTAERFVSLWVYPERAWRNRILAGWGQFEEDLTTHVPVEVIPAAVAAPVMALPELSIKVSGSLALTDNLQVFGDQLNQFIERIDRAPSDDQGFADAEQAVKILKNAEDALEAAMDSALSQTATVSEMCRTVEHLKDVARNARLSVEKLVKARKEAIRVDEVERGRRLLREHIGACNKAIGRDFMPPIPEGFAAAIKGRKTVATLREAVDSELTRLKIDASLICEKIQANLATLDDVCLERDYRFLFNDLSTLVLKAPDDFIAAIKTRVSEHAEAEEKRLEAEREKIRREEAARFEQQVRETEKPKALAGLVEMGRVYGPNEDTRRPILSNPQAETRPLPETRAAQPSGSIIPPGWKGRPADPDPSPATRSWIAIPMSGALTPNNTDLIIQIAASITRGEAWMAKYLALDVAEIQNDAQAGPDRFYVPGITLHEIEE